MSPDKKITISSNQKIDQNYQSLLKELRGILDKGLYKAYKAVDNAKVQTYWQLGERIVREEFKNRDRANYGEYLMNNLEIDLGLKKRDLYRIVQFYRYYEIVSTVPTQLSWGHILELIVIDNKNKRIFYQNKAIINSWSIREIRKQIKNQFFENMSPQEIEKILRVNLSATKPQEIFKDTYNFNFIELAMQESEKDLERKLVENFKNFLNELGPDFAILGNQVPIKIDHEVHSIDLVLFHKGIPCNVLVDLKIGKLDSRDIGQMNKYVEYYRQNRQYEYEQDSIGLIICRQAGQEEVKYALGGLEEKIFIAKYKVKLPSEEKIKKIIHEL